MANLDLEDVITSSIEDATTPEDPIQDTAEVDVETPDTPETPQDAPESTTEAAPEDPTSAEVQSPAAKADAAATPAKKDDFDSKYGLTKESSPGRENRIPYSRVKKIVGKAEQEAKAATEALFTPKVQEYEAKVKDYEGRLTQVAQFEQVMLNDKERFIQMLTTIPGYTETFSKLFGAPASQAQAPETSQAPASDDMPQPDQTLSDGSKVYSMEGLRALNAWNREQARKETLAEVEKRFGPIENEWKAHQQIQAIIPQVQAQINEARTWPQFVENEAEIVKVLQADPNISLERAYQKVILPKLQTSRDTMRAELLKEIKKVPTTTSAPAGSTRPTSTPTGPRNLEDVISESLKALR